jgi:hypothetical protein
MIMQPYPLFIQLENRDFPALVVGWDDSDIDAEMRPMALCNVDGVSVMYRVGVDERWIVVNPVES